MPAISRDGDSCTGHGCFPPRTGSATVSTVFVNDILVHVIGDPFVVHRCGRSRHSGTISAGSGTVFAEGKAIVRIGDPIDCGSALAEGSSNVFCG